MKQSSEKFDGRLEKCTAEIQNVIDFLRTVAENVGPHVDQPHFDAKGEGISFSARGRPFCRFDPKFRVHRVWVWISDADQRALKVIGAVPNRKHGPWVSVNNVASAERLVPEIRRAYDRCSRGKPATRR